MLKVVGASWTQTKIISTTLLSLVCVGVLVFIFGEYERAVEDGTYSATMYWSEDMGFRTAFWGQGNRLEDVPRGIARAYYKPDVLADGWAELEIQTQADSPDWRQAYAAGFLEGCLTWQMIQWHWVNTVRDACEGREDFCREARAFLELNTEWARETAKRLGSSDPFWHQIELFYLQLDGLEHGWRNGVERSLQVLDIPSIDFLWMNVVNDLADLEQKFGISSESPNHDFQLSSTKGLSSAFIKLLPEARQLFVAHNTGGLYQSMLRIRKRYEFNYHVTSAPHAELVPGQVISFTSYPAALHSQDDFYLVSGAGGQGKKHQLAVVGTALHYDNLSWSNVQLREKVLIGPRAMAANRLASSGHAWARQMTSSSGSTGSKQWLVADYGHLALRPVAGKKKSPKRLRHHHEVRGLLWILEELPGHSFATDISSKLEKQGYWSASDGQPFFKVRPAGGASTGEQRDDPLSPIAQIFARDHSQVVDVESVVQLMRSNNYLEDPLSSRNPLRAIGSRGDLLAASPRPVGAIDSKVVAGSPGQRTEMHVVSGPAPVNVATHGVDSSNDDGDVANSETTPQHFRWSGGAFGKLYHFGQPDVWRFPSVLCNWVWTNKYEEGL